MGKDAGLLWYCCSCSHFWSYAIYPACVNCHHRRGQCCRLSRHGKPQRATSLQVGRQILPVSQTPLQGPAHSPTSGINDSGVRKAPRAEPFPRPYTTSQNFSAAKNPDKDSIYPNLPLGVPSHLDEKYTIVSEQPQTICQVPRELAEQKADQVRVGDTDRSTIGHLLTSARHVTFDLAATSLVFLNRLADPLEQWLETIATAGIRNPLSITSPLPFSISDHQTAEPDMKEGLRASVSTEGSSAVTLEVQSAYTKAPILAIEEQPPVQHCATPGFSNCMTSPAPHAHRNCNTTTGQDIAVVSRSHAYHSNGAGTPSPPDCRSYSSVDELAPAEKDIFDLLIQLVYSALYFDPSGSFRKCGSGQSALPPATSRSSGQTLTTPRKRQLEGDRDREPNSDDDDNRKSEKTKRSKTSNGTLGQTQRRFACLHCKCDLAYGDEAQLKCAGWSSLNIDNVLRRHLVKHVPYGHISEAKYLRVRDLMKEFKVSDRQQAEELWIAAYMEVFDIDERDRNTVPSPYFDSTNLANNPDMAALTTRLMDQISRNPTTAIQLRNYVRANADLDRARIAGRERLRERFRAQEAQLILENHAQREAAERELDNEYDARQLRLNTELESALDSRQQSGHSNHITPREGVRTTLRNSHGSPNVSGSGSANEQHILSPHPPSSQVQRFTSSAPTNLPMLSAPNSAPESDWRSTTHETLYETFISIDPLSMNGYDVENESFLDIVTRQTRPPIPATSRRNAIMPADVVHSHANDATEGSNSTLQPTNNTRDTSSSRFELSPDSGYGSSYTPCSCGRICHVGQDRCDSCSDAFNNRPWF